MPSRQRLILPPFDPAADFVVARDFMCGGIVRVMNEPFDKDLVSPRRLRQLAAIRKITAVSGTGSPRFTRGRYLRAMNGFRDGHDAVAHPEPLEMATPEAEEADPVKGVGQARHPAVRPRRRKQTA